MNGRAFLDASFWIVYRDEKDANHSTARRVMSDLFRQRTHFVTTLPVACEIHAYFARERQARDQVLNDLFGNPVLTVENISHQDQKAAREILQIHHDKTYSLCDALSFIVMRRLNLKRVVAFDQHFRQFGEFETIP
ncbi:MAG TPA: hypothetical protein VGI03_08395 [Verrucomicrobiae bacterium]|jgi:predicted nucleic acid-binding protein